MYVDGHECKDVIQYRNKFIGQWKKYQKRFLKFDNDGNQTNQLVGFLSLKLAVSESSWSHMMSQHSMPMIIGKQNGFIHHKQQLQRPRVKDN
jgi:hypothetical protein